MTSERDLMREEFQKWWTEPDPETGQSYADCYGSPVIAWLAWSESRRTQHSTAEPFGYFRAEPFGWTDCAETDEGAKALYEAAPQQAPLPRLVGVAAAGTKDVTLASFSASDVPPGTRLFAGSSPHAEPLAPEQIEHIATLDQLTQNFKGAAFTFEDVERIVRATEQAHGIGTKEAEHG